MNFEDFNPKYYKSLKTVSGISSISEKKPKINLKIGIYHRCKSLQLENSYNCLNLDEKNSFFEKYQLLEEIGKGFQAKVYKIMEKSSKIIYACKIYHSYDEELIQKIVNEKEILENLNHKNIINFVDYHSDEENGVYVIVTEYFPSITLKTFLEGWISDYSQRINLFRKLYDCISYLHRQKVLHRDLNVENILISTENLEFKIIDFGVALNLKNQDFILNDEGNIKYRMKETYFTSDDPLGIDCWGLQLIFLSLFFQKVYSSKEAYEMFKMNNVPQIIEDKFNINLALKVFSEKRDSRQFLNGLFIVLDLQ